MYKIVGFNRRTGTYEGYDYDNINMHCINEETEGMIGGNSVEIIKIKVSTVKDVFDGLVQNDNDLRSLIGARCRVMYGRGGKYASVVEIKDQGGGETNA